MSWSDHVGYVLLIRGGGALRRDQKPLFDTLVDVLKSAADYWRGQERPFWAFFLDVQPDPTLPPFPDFGAPQRDRRCRTRFRSRSS